MIMVKEKVKNKFKTKEERRGQDTGIHSNLIIFIKLKLV